MCGRSENERICSNYCVFSRNRTLSDVYVGMENGVICHHVVMRFKEVLFFGHCMYSNMADFRSL